MLQIEAQITEMSTAPRSGTIRHDAYPAVARQSRGATGGDDMKPGMSALLRGNTLRVVAPSQALQVLHEANRQQPVSFKACPLSFSICGRFDDSQWRTRGGGVQTPPPPKFRRYRWSPQSHDRRLVFLLQFTVFSHGCNSLNKGFF